jgi:hypothetical protein
MVIKMCIFSGLDRQAWSIPMAGFCRNPHFS